MSLSFCLVRPACLMKMCRGGNLSFSIRSICTKPRVNSRRLVGIARKQVSSGVYLPSSLLFFQLIKGSHNGFRQRLVLTAPAGCMLNVTFIQALHECPQLLPVENPKQDISVLF